MIIVRQTVSKWENGKSVPDAEALINMAALFEVPVAKLLGIEREQSGLDDLTEELSRLNEELAKKNRQEALVKRANEKRGVILFLSFVSMLIVLGVKNQIISLVLSGGCILAAVIILYRNLALMTSITTVDMRIKVLRVTTIFNIVILISGIMLGVLTAMDVIRFSEHGEKIVSMLFVACIMIFIGVVSPKLPFTRHTGLRLPWTVRDEDTWNLAHRILGYISLPLALPLALLYTACALTMDHFEQVTIVTIVLWIGIPGGISYIFYRKKK